MPSGDVLVLVDEDGRVLEWGRAAEELFGRSAEEAVGRSLGALLRGTDLDAGSLGTGSPCGLPVRIEPVLRGSSVLWRVLAATDPAPSQQDAAVLRTVFAHSPMEVLVLDPQLRVLRMSAAFGGSGGGARAGGSPPRRPFTEVFALDHPEAEAAVARRVLESGEPVLDRLVRGAWGPGRPKDRVRSVSYFRLEDRRGAALGVVATSVDVTDRVRAQGRLDLLDEVHTRLGQVPNVGIVCQQLVDVVVPALADTAVVEIVDDVVRGEEPPKVPVHRDVPVRRAAVRGGSAYPVGEVRPLPAGTPFAEVLSDLRARLLPVEEHAPWLAADPVRGAVILERGARSLIVAPLTLRDQALGVVSFYRGQGRAPFDEDDLRTASAVCAHAALCVENARQYMREWIIASTLQRRLLPGQPALRPSVEVSQLHHSGPEGGGAWSDAIPLPGARTALVVGEVAGHGMVAAITMGLVRTALHTLAGLDLPPDELLARLSETAGRLAAASAALPGPGCATLDIGCAIAVYDPVELTCVIARAGLPEPVAVLPDGTSDALAVPPGPLLSGPDDAPFPTTTAVLPAGSTLALATGAFAERVLAPSAPLRPLLDGAVSRPLPEVRDAIASAFAGSGGSDEAELLLARTSALPADRVLTRVLPAGAEAAPLARGAVRRRLAAWGVGEETAFTTELIVSELVGNAVRYGAPPLRLRMVLEQMLTCEVSDTAVGAPHVKHARTVDENGRGLFIVAGLADQWGVRYRGQGKTVWAQQPLGPREDGR
ncbi:SpoIIE family protein phosphatase [Actinacidiphila sp. bgisy167]|uniref:ATP-binding SpoIIE family protein phosphatase n=1 Tax=Actinacidiphila sp. bgisy167 TaxID=3413797 RepID=UPI003D764C1C